MHPLSLILRVMVGVKWCIRFVLLFCKGTFQPICRKDIFRSGFQYLHCYVFHVLQHTAFSPAFCHAKVRILPKQTAFECASQERCLFNMHSQKQRFEKMDAQVRVYKTAPTEWEVRVRLLWQLAPERHLVSGMGGPAAKLGSSLTCTTCETRLTIQKLSWRTTRVN